ncbi:hypothetical protein LZG04_24555 [Saccharothrix sp. S26]|uniref:hypothetical protein n=1 Tax=Saccharothrix sp. S26 TaxID=2907215 RepID=UPI001F2D9BFC|nr:hypothetical protein [Saccharothrix sp. S26]MCE6997946.1 hypothetical protein [Saccharothrix sp. S26]
MNRLALIAACLFGLTLTATTPASAADVSPHCGQPGYCLFSGTSFTGTRATVPPTYGCHPVSALGFTPARSAARGFGDGSALELFADTTCITRLATVYDEVPTTTAVAYRLTPIPA